VTGGPGSVTGGKGSAFGSGLFLQGNGGITFSPGSGQTQTIADVIADQTGSGGSGGNAGSYSLTVNGAGTLALSGANTYSGGTTVTSGSTLNLANNTGAGTGSITLQAGTTLGLNNVTIANTVSGSGDPDIAVAGASSMPTFTGTAGTTFNILGTDNSATTDVLTVTTANAAYAGTTNVGGTSSGNSVTLKGGASNAFGSTSAVSVLAGSALDLGGFDQTIASLSGGGTVTNGGASGTSTLTIGGGTATSFSGKIADGATASTALRLSNSGTSLTLSDVSTYSGATTINSGTTLALSGTGAIASSSVADSGNFSITGLTDSGTSVVSLTGNGNVALGANTLTLSNASGTFSGTIAGTGGLTLTGGTETLSGTSTYTGATIVNGGTLDVAGSITATSSVRVNSGGTLDVTGTVADPTINSGGTLTGTGTVGATQINAGGTFAPGNGTAGTSMTIAGNLAFASGAIYLVQVNPSTSSFATVIGTATPGGATVNAVFANGSYVSRQYKILTASSGVSGTFASNAVNTNLPANFHTSLSYDANDAYLNLALNFAIPGGLNRNQQAVGNALTGFFNANDTIPLVYGALSPAALTQASGELGTSSQQTTFNAMGQFMGLLSDPFMQRNGGAGLTPGAAGFAEEEASGYAAYKRTDAFAMFTKAPPVPFVQRWSVWAAGFGGSQSTDGNTVVGSNNTTSSIYGTAVGADYLFSPNTLAGFAVAGGGTSFNVNALGSGRSDLFQAGAYVRHTNGPAYISAALAYGWQDITTDRIVTAAGIDHLRAEFNANAWSGRTEGGYRFVAPWSGIGLTPYAAAQFTTFDLPAYAEQVISGASTFALSYGAHSPTDTRSELGLRSDKSFALDNAVLTLRGRVAWAHDFDPDRSIAATFQALPGASFAVNGAGQAADSALTTASAELKWTNGWSMAATFEGEFSAVTRSYAGKGVVRYAW
jgi:autotransporter-associated beta strand protein